MIPSRNRSAVVASAAIELHAVVEDLVDQPMLLSHAPRPEVRALVPQPLRLPDSGDRVAAHRLDQVDDAGGNARLALDPEAEVVEKGW